MNGHFNVANAYKRALPDLLGVQLLEVSPQKIIAEMLIGKESCNFTGVLYGGAIMTFADTLGAMETVLNMPETAVTSTLESKTNFLSSSKAGETITAKTTPVHLGRRTMVWETIVTKESEKKMAIVTQTQMIMEARSKLG